MVTTDKKNLPDNQTSQTGGSSSTPTPETPTNPTNEPVNNNALDTLKSKYKAGTLTDKQKKDVISLYNANLKDSGGEKNQAIANTKNSLNIPISTVNPTSGIPNTNPTNQGVETPNTPTPETPTNPTNEQNFESKLSTEEAQKLEDARVKISSRNDISIEEQNKLLSELDKKTIAENSLATKQAETTNPPTQTPEEKIKAAQDIKAQELANKSTEQAQVTAEQEKSINAFSQALLSGNLGQAKDLAIQNPDLRGVFNSQVKLTLGNKANAKFFGKYAGMSNEQMLAEVKSGNLVVGSEQYKLLPEGQRASFETYNAQNSAITVTEPTDFTVDKTQTISLNDLVAQMKSLFSTDLKTKYNELLNSDAITSEAKGLEGLQNQITTQDDKLDRIQDEVRAEFPNLPASAQNAIIDDRSKNIIREKNTLVNQYNAKLGTYKSLKEDAQTQLDFFKWQDGQDKEIYKTALALYETRRGEMREDEKLKFLEQNKQLAEDTQFARQKELATFNEQLRANNNSGGNYIDNGKGDIVYVKDGKEINVLSGLGKPKATSETEQYTFKTYENDDGTYTVFGLPKSGNNIFQKNFGVNGEEATNYIQTLGTGSITGYGGAYDKFQGLDVDGNIGDPVSIPQGGEVVEAMTHPAYGTTVVIKMEDGNKIRLSHLNEGFVLVGDKVDKGAIIGTIGNSGNVLKLDGTKPTKAELNSGFGSHLDIVTTDANGNIRSSKQTESYLNNIGVDTLTSKISENTTLAQGILNGTSSLSDFTPTDKRKIVPELNKLIEKQLTNNQERNVIVKSSSSNKDVSDSALNKIEDMNVVKFQLSALEDTLKKANTGPILGILSGKNPYNTEAQVSLAILAGITPKVARGIFGEVGVLTDTDIKNYQRALPNLHSTEEKNALVVSFMRDLLSEGYKNAIVTQAKGGRNMSQFLNDYDSLITGQRVNQFIGGQNIVTPSGFKYNTSGTINKQNDFFN